MINDLEDIPTRKRTTSQNARTVLWNYNLFIYLSLILLYIIILTSGGLYIGNGAIVGLGICKGDITLASDCCGADQCRWTTNTVHGCGLDISQFVMSGLGVVAPQITIVLFAFYCLLTFLSLVYCILTLRKMNIPTNICYQISYSSFDTHPAIAYAGFQSFETKEATRLAGSLLSKLTPIHRKVIFRFIWPFSLFLNGISIVVYVLLKRSFQAMVEPLYEANIIGNVCNYGSECPPVMQDAVNAGICNSNAMVVISATSLCLQTLLGLMFFAFVRCERSHRRRLPFS